MINYSQASRSAPHWLTLIATLSLFSFAFQSQDKEYRWLWSSVKVAGVIAAAAAIRGYASEGQRERQSERDRELLGVASDVRQGYEWQLSNLQSQHQQTLYQVQAERDRLVSELESQISQLQQAIAQAEEETFYRVETAKDRMAVDFERFQSERERLEQEQALLEQHYEAREQELSDRESQLEQQTADLKADTLKLLEQERSEVEAEFAARKQDLDSQLEAVLAAERAAHADQIGTIQSVLQDVLKYNHTLKTPDLPEGRSHEELLAREAIRCLHEHGIIVKKPFVQSLAGNRFSLSFEVLPVLADGEISTAIRSSGEALKQITKQLIKPLRMAVPGCCTDPTAEPIVNGIKLTFDVSGTDWQALEQELKAKADKVQDPAPEHLAEFILQNPQICLMGDTGEGKTTLINHLTRLMTIELGDQAELLIINPKPDADTDLSKLKYATFESSIFGLLEAATEILHRLDLTTTALLRRREEPGFPLPQFVPVIYFFDEFSELTGVWNRCKPDVMEATLTEFEQQIPPAKRKAMDLIRMRVSPGTFAADLLKFCWRVGRSEKVKLLVAGQNLKAGTIGTTIQDLHQTALIYLGEAIREGLDNRVSSWQREPLSQEYASRSQKVAEQKASKYYGLFVPKSRKAYFATLPHPSGAAAPALGADAVRPLLDSGADAVRPAPDAPSAPDAVRELERLWGLDSEEIDHSPRTTDGPRTNAVRPQHDPLDPEISRSLVADVLRAFDAYRSQTKAIEIVWGAQKSGSSNGYRAAKWKFRRILHKHGRRLPGKLWGKDADDLKSFTDLLND